MSAYAHQMERRFSAQSLSSGGDSEMDSRYTLESGFYMTSFAATIFIGGLITVGVLLITLLVALTVMLQSCLSKNSGVVEVIRSTDDDYNYCKIFSLHAELNKLEMDEFPVICRGLAVKYIKQREYDRDLNLTVRVIEGYFGNILPSDDGLDVVLMDVDDILSSGYQHSILLTERSDQCRYTYDYIEEAKHLQHMLTLKLFMKLRAGGWPVILFSRKSYVQQNATSELLLSAGFRNWSLLIMRLADEMGMDSREYLTRRRSLLQEKGFRIIGLISSQMDALTGQNIGKRGFKLPNPFYYNLEHDCDSKETSV